MTTATQPFVYKQATEPWELEQVHRLNYQTFVEEIPQHAPNETQRLVDRFDDENVYFICLRGDQVLGMIAMRTRRPWSLDHKLPDVDRYLPAGKTFCELRLLAIHPEHRGGPIIRGLMTEVMRYGVRAGFTGAVISGAVRQQRLYEHMGFVPFGPVVGTVAAPYQPMYITHEALREFRVSAAPPAPEPRRDGPLSFLPGPVDIHPDVLAALGGAPVSHREGAFVERVGRLRETLCAIVGARHVQVLLGSGTLANDVIAAQLGLTGLPGLVLSNGEFGDRLIDHAARAGLSFATEQLSWGAPFDAHALDRALSRHPAARWVWMVHLETSTGVLNDLQHLAAASRARGIRVAADCVSAVGVVPVEAGELDWVSAVSGKGIASVPGLSMVFHRSPPPAAPRLPRYLDLQLYAECDSVPFTQSSNLVAALEVAAARTLLRGRFTDAEKLSRWFRGQLRARGHDVVASESCAAPGIVTVRVSDGTSAVALGDALRDRGFALSYRSGYLMRRNWIQVAMMGECTRGKLESLLAVWDALGYPFSNR